MVPQAVLLLRMSLTATCQDKAHNKADNGQQTRRMEV
jgi:hypothetical protein